MNTALITPTLSLQKEYRRRRNRLMNLMGDGSVAVLASPPVVMRNRDVAYPYRQDSDLFYLTGICDSDIVLVLAPNHEEGECILFCKQHDVERARWDGPSIGFTEAIEYYGMNCAYSLDKLHDFMSKIVENKRRVYHTMGRDKEFDQQVLSWFKPACSQRKTDTGIVPNGLICLDPLLHEMRLFKSAEEIKIMRKAARISAAGHIAAMKACKANMMEYEIEAEFIYHTARQGAKRQAYAPIVGGGANGCILHYQTNNQALKNGDLLLIDAGAEYRGYASDITRTWPVNGKFNSRQRDLYQVVLESQKEAIKAVSPGKCWSDPHRVAVECLTRGLVDLGILNGKVRKLITDRAFAPYFTHRIGHWLGMDVHDVGDYKLNGEWRTLESGMVLTIEPGLYFSSDIPGLAKEWHNLAVRIEDDILVTDDGIEILSKDAPSSIEAIEAIMSS